jgi:hypothetical protein
MGIRPLAAILSGFSRAAARKARGVFPAHPRRIRGPRVPRHVFPGAGRLCHAHAGLHFLRAVGDILRNHIPLSTVGDYLINLTPSMLYQIAPLAVLIAVLVTFGVLNRNSEIIAMKATGISLYRLVVPIVSIAAILAVSLFLFDEYYLPQANRGRRRCATSSRAARRRPSAPRTELDLRPAAPRRARPHLLLPVLRSRPQRVRQSLGLRVRSLHLRALAAHLCRPRSLGSGTGSWRFQNGWQRDIEGANVTEYREFRKLPSPRFTKTPATSRKKACRRRR